MANKRIYLVKGFKNTEVISVGSPDELRTFIAAAQAPRLLTVYRDGGNYNAKTLLPCLVVGTHIDGMPLLRKDANFAPGTHVLLDYDKPTPNPETIAGNVVTQVEAMGLDPYVYMERSASGRFHMLMPRRTADTAADIEYYSSLFGLDFDRTVTNTSRLMALTGEALAGTSLEALFREVPSRTPFDDVDDDDNENVDENENPQPSTFPELYHGLPYTAIVDALIEETGGEPCVGERNNRLYRLAAELRVITDANPDWIAQLLSPYGYFDLPEEEAMATIRSACRKTEAPVISYTLRTAIDNASLAEVDDDDDDNVDDDDDENENDNQQSVTAINQRPEGAINRSEASLTSTEGAYPQPSTPNPFADTPWDTTPPAMPPLDQLPTFVRVLVRNVPEHLIPHVLNTCEPALFNYLYGTTTVGIDGSLLYLGEGILAISIAPASSGKSSRNEPLKAINHRHRMQDLEARRLIDEWNETARCSKTSDLPERPKLESHLLGADCTPSAMLQKLKALERGALLITVDELNMLLALKSNASENHTPLLLAFSSEDLEVERSSEAGVSGIVAVRLNLSAMGTPYQAATFFKNGWHSGLITRCSLSTIVDPEAYDDDDFVYGSYRGYQETIDPYIDLLVAQAGNELITAECDELARNLRKWSIDMAARHSSDTLRILARRQAILCQKRNYLYWLLEGQTWSPNLEAFLTWRYKYGLWAMYRILGSIIESEQKSESAAADATAKRPGPASWLEQLPKTFTREQLKQVRQRKGASVADNKTSHLISTWKNRGLVVENPDGSYTKK